MSTTSHDDSSNMFLSPRQLGGRQGVSLKKLAHDRLNGRGVPYCKFGRLCRYRLSDVLAYEERHRRLSTSNGGADV